MLNKSKNIWQSLQFAQAEGSNEELFMNLLETYGSRCFLSEVVNACLETSTGFFVAPYMASPQLVHFFREQQVHCVMGSAMCLLYSSSDSLKQVVVDFDFERASFSFVDQEDLMSTFSPKQNHDQLIDLFIVHGALYGLSIVQDVTPESFAKTVADLSSNSDQQDLNSLLKLDPQQILDMQFLKIIF